MATEKLTIDLGEVEKCATKLQGVIDIYNICKNQPFAYDLDLLNTMNSDFNAKLKTMLEDLNDSDKSLYDEYMGIVVDAFNIIKTLDEVDEILSKRLKIVEG